MAPKDVDKTVDHTATVHGYWMGGKDHFTASWEAAEELLRARPPPTLAPSPARDTHVLAAPLTAPPARGGTFQPIDKVIITLRSVATHRRALGVRLGTNLADGRGVGLSADLLRLRGSHRLRHRRQPAPAADGRDERGLPDHGPVLRPARARVLLAVGPGRPGRPPSCGRTGAREQGIRAAAGDGTGSRRPGGAPRPARRSRHGRRARGGSRG